MLKRLFFYSLLIFTCCFIPITFAQTITINALHDNDESGVPLLLDQTVTISGEVTVTNQFGTVSYLQDGTAGVATYDANFTYAVNIGDYVTITGKVTQYNGLTELKNVTIVEHVPGTPQVEPQVVTCADIANEGRNGIENYEGELVRINGVTVNTYNWNVSGSGSNFTLTDATGSCAIRIDNDTNIANTVSPGDSLFDVIGVVSQYDRDSPYTEGYQLMPRFVEDIIWLKGPRITAKPVETDITPYSLTISWETETPANSILMYGQTTDYEIDTLRIEELVTYHQVPLTNLNPGIIYHIKAGAGDNTGINYAADYVVITASDPASTGEINVYFSKSVDQSLAYQQNEASGGVNLANRFIERVNRAQYSIDLCFYSWNLSNVTSALIDAHNRGVKIRFIHDDDHYYQDQVIRLKGAGITVIDQSFSNTGSYGIQHNKFAIFDARDDSYVSDDWVWTGSLNMTDYNGLGINAAQNVIEIQDQSLAKAYTVEFNEMWGSPNDTPNASLSKFGRYKQDNTPHRFIINETPVELYMCPSDGATSKLIKAVDTANYEIFFCILAFTRIDLKQAMYEKYSTIDGFDIRGVFDSGQSAGSQWYSMSGTGDYAWNPPADVWLDGEYGVLHHKYMIIDALHANSDPIVITGSQNWSTRAETQNDENTLIIYDANIANQYLQEFAARYHAAGGTNDLTEVEMAEQAKLPYSFRLDQNYPNPFNRQTTIRMTLAKRAEVSLKIYNLVGQHVRTIELGDCQPGNYNIIWNGLDDAGQEVAGGVYLYRLHSSYIGQDNRTRKMIFLP